MAEEEKEQVIRLMAQQLYQMGYSESAQCLEQESGVPMENTLVKSLRHNIRAQHYHEAIQNIKALQLPRDKENLGIFIILREVYITLIEGGHCEEAITLLRTQMKQHSTCQEDIHVLAGLVLCKSKEEVRD